MSKEPKSNIRAKTRPGVAIDVPDTGDSPGTPDGPRHQNLKKFEDLLLTVDDGAPELEKSNRSETPQTARVQLQETDKLSEKKQQEKGTSNNITKSLGLRRRSRNFAKMTIHSASESSDRMAMSLTKRSAVPASAELSPRKPINAVTQTSANKARRTPSKTRFGLKNIFSSSPSKREKAETVGKEIYGSKIVEEALLHTQSISFVKEFQPNIIVPGSFGWAVERPTIQNEAVFDNCIVEFHQFESLYYITEFYQKDHYNYFATEKTLGNCVISLRKDKEANLIRVLFRTKKGTIKMEVNPASVKKISSKTLIRDLALNEERYPNYTLTNIRAIDHPALQESLVQFEKADVFKRYKFGVLLVKEGQTRDDEFFANREPTPHFEEFLEVLGEKIELQGWKKYAGGLNTSNHSTGTHSVYRPYFSMGSKYEIMFHVSTMLPFFEDDLQHVERKRHLGNDVVNIIFNDSSLPFNPTSIVTNFIHTYVVVSVDSEATEKNNATHYRVEIANQNQVPKYNPPLRDPPVFSKEELKEWLPSKLINAERAAFLAPAIRFKLTGTRKQLLSDIFSEFG